MPEAHSLGQPGRGLYAGPAGAIEVVEEHPRQGAARALALIAHPHPLYGGTLDNKVVYTLGHSLLEGLWHIAGGWDHLAFLLGLLLLARGLGALVALVTGFTLGHSAALLLSVLGGLRPPASIVEGAIAASIVYVGLPAASRRERAAAVAVIGLIALVGVLLLPAEWAIWTGLALLALAHRRLADEAAPPTGAAAAGLLLAASFGLLHGFGFAGAVLEQAGEAPRLWPLLLGFNLGVELGQLALILPAWWWLGRQRRPHATRWTQAAVCGLGAYWLTARLLAL